MKNALWSLVLLVLILVAFLLPAAFSATLSSTFSLSGNAASSSGAKKPEAESLSEEKKNVRSKEDQVNLEDYSHYDPTPSSKSRIHSGPIEHGSPLNPYVVPKSPPPPPPSDNHPKPGPSPSPL